MPPSLPRSAPRRPGPRRRSSERARLLERLADLIERDLDELAALESRDTGKTVKLARSARHPARGRELPLLRRRDHAVVRAKRIAMDDRALNYTLRQPLGVVGVHLAVEPAALSAHVEDRAGARGRQHGRGQAVGDHAVTARRLGELSIEAGFPPGVLNIVHGIGPASAPPLVEHPDASRRSRSPAARAPARRSPRAAAPKFKKLSLELGGKNPTIVFADCDLSDANLDTIVRSGFANQGEICLCGSRILVERIDLRRVRGALLERVRALRVGDPHDAATDLGALVSQAHFDKVIGYIDLARDEGGRVLCGGDARKVDGRCANGWFVEPTVIEGLGPDCATNQEEIFGRSSR